ncbi:Protein NRT1/ PTR FAMILY 5.10 [Linum perenne]
MSTSGRSLPDAETPLLDDDTVDGAVDYKGHQVRRSSSGGWRSAAFIIGVEVAERFAYYGIGSNLITYLTGPLGQSTAAAAANVNAWAGASSLMPLLGAFVADTFLGKYRTIIIASVGYVLVNSSPLGLGLLTLSAILPALGVFDCQSQVTNTSAAACPPHPVQIALFFFSLYLIALSQGGHKPCVQAFGADQFDSKDPVECKAKSSFFNWWYFCMCAGTVVALGVLNYVQDNINWGLGFGIPCLVMVLALIIFLLGTRTYRYGVTRDEDNGFLRICKVFGAAIRNWHIDSSAVTLEEESRGTLPCEHSDQLKFLNKALLASDGSKNVVKVCTLSEVEEAKSVLRLVPIWANCVVYGIVFAQSSTFFTKQGLTMDRTLFPGFVIPPATLQSFITLAICIFIPMYDGILVPVARAITGKLSGISMLQRIGTGIFLSLVSMVIAAVVEIKRLQIARDHGIIDTPGVMVPMSFWWLIPQYVLFGISDVFTMIGLQEFFYDQAPSDLRSMGLSLYLSIFGVGSFLSSFLISAIDKATSSDGHDSWFSNNINKGHLDYFYWLLAGLSAVQLILYLYFAKSYVYNKGSSV